MHGRALLTSMLLALAGAALPACSRSGPRAAVDAGTQPEPDAGHVDGGAVDGGPLELDLHFTRSATLDFVATATVTSGGAPVTDAGVTFTSSKGTVASPTGTESSPGQYQTTIRAQGSGEYVVTATVAGRPPLTATHTALVFGAVGDRWDQPQRVEGLVNTPGWEDGVFITRDAQYLFVQYLPVSVSCIWGDTAACKKAVGPITAPARPAFIGADRIDAGVVINTCFGLSPSQLSRYYPPCDYYGFKRQPDGSYRKPFRLGFEGSSGCLCPVGLDAYPHGDGGALVLFSYDDPQTYGANDTGSEFEVANIALGQNTNMGTWTGTFGSGGVQNPIYRRVPIPHAPLALGVNPYGRFDSAGTLDDIWFDNEHLDGGNGIYRTQLQGDGGWSGPALIGPPVSLDTVDERMPFFENDLLTIRRDSDLASIPKTPAGWGTYKVDLSPDPTTPPVAGQIVAVGEPTIAVDPATGRDLLFFNYGVQQPDGTVDLNVGFVRAR